jgi:hypothetical protein
MKSQKLPMPKSKKNKNKGKLNLTVREEQRNRLEQMASLEKRSVSNLIEVMADERWEGAIQPSWSRWCLRRTAEADAVFSDLRAMSTDRSSSCPATAR